MGLVHSHRGEPALKQVALSNDQERISVALIAMWFWLTFGDKRLERSETTLASSWIAEDASERPYKVSVINRSLLQFAATQQLHQE
jgi:hypothetical protein